ncbi:hypothetical protein VTP01DRAFT_718 [Rhizomucor pusillus]|uniref:uncharacterized protein n=1 Tax=Rhizomucor pusillus TaxID=4840 RepID=UPI003742DF6B
MERNFQQTVSCEHDMAPEVSNIDVEECVSSGMLCHDTSYHDFAETEKKGFQSALLAWYDRDKRTNMPWRKPTRTDLDREALSQRAYEVWVSEIMLQQTQVATVIDYYNRWMEAFPTIHDLANADIEQVNTLWAGLGYYSRARRLWEGAQKIVKELSGQLPNNAKDLEQQIPGVGRYTAGAIASIVFNEKTPVVDGNVIRVIARMRAIGADPKKASTVQLFWDIATSIVSEEKPGDFNQALMELGARICTPQKPSCDICPVKEYCHAVKQLETHLRMKSEKFVNNSKKRRRSVDHTCKYCPQLQSPLSDDDYTVTRYPFKPEKKKPREEDCATYIVECVREKGSKFLLSKRPETGLLAGLWEFPCMELENQDSTYEERKARASSFLKEKFGLIIENDEPSAIIRKDLGNVVHLFSHIRKVYHLEWIQVSTSIADTCVLSETTKWIDADELKDAPIPTALKKAIKIMEQHRSGKSAKKPKTSKSSLAAATGSKSITSFFTAIPR